MTFLTNTEIKRIEKRLETDTDSECKEDMIIKYAFYKTCLMKIEALTPELKKYGIMPLVV
jgi:hypothetical protein